MGGKEPAEEDRSCSCSANILLQDLCDCGREARECGQPVGNASALSTGCPHGPQGSRRSEGLVHNCTDRLIARHGKNAAGVRWGSSHQPQDRGNNPRSASEQGNLPSHTSLIPQGAAKVLAQSSRVESQAPAACRLGTKRCICDTLAALYARGKLTLRAGKVQRKALAEELGVTKRSVDKAVTRRRSRAPGRCIARFDQFLNEQGHARLWTERLPAIRARLEQCRESGTLPTSNQGTLNRSAVLREFAPENKCILAVLKKNPDVKALLDEYDVIQGDDGYSPYKYDALEKKLEELLDSDDLELMHARKINKKWLARTLGVRSNIFWKTPKLGALITKKQAELDQRQRRGTTAKAFRIHGADHINLGATPYSNAHKRVFDFSGLIPGYGLKFTEQVATTFMAVAAKLASAQAEHRRVMHFLTWLAALPETTMAQQMRNGQDVDPREFVRVALLYQQETTYDKVARRKKRVSPGFGIIEKLGEAGLFPRVHFTRSVDRRRHRMRNPRPSLAEAPNIDADAKKILEAAETTSKYRDVVIDRGKDAIAFVQTLAIERARRTDLPESIPEASRILCDERLVELRKSASAIVEPWRKTYQEGRELIAEAEYEGAQIYEMLEQERANGIQTGRWNTLVESLFPPAEPRRALANLLAMLEAKFHGICPNGTNDAWGQFWIARYRNVGGTRAVQAYLCPPRLVVSAVVFLYLCESGANSDVAVQMRPNAIRASRRPRHVIVAGRKARARNRAIFSELPMRQTAEDCTSAAEALLFYADAVRPLRTGHEDMPLFVHVSKNRLKALNDWHLYQDLPAIAATSKRLASLQICPTMIRSTVLLSMQLRHPNSIEAVQMFAQHKSDTTTAGYVAKLPHRMILEQRMRQFSETIEVVISDEDTWKKMGHPVARWQEAIQTARRTGLGVWCQDPQAGAQPDVPTGTTCHTVDRCLSCSKVIVIADEESVADMIVWSKALKDAEPAWLEDNAERWTAHWVPWKAFFEVVLNEKMTRGVLATIKKRASDKAAARMALPQFKAPKPW